MSSDAGLLNSLLCRWKSQLNPSSFQGALKEEEIKQVLYDEFLLEVKKNDVSDNVADEKLQIVLNYIDANFGENITLEVLADKANLSAFHFSRWFKRHKNKSPLRYVNDLRIEKSKQLLLDKNKSITTIAYETGHGSTSSFIVKFKKKVGDTPGYYRKNNT